MLSSRTYMDSFVSMENLDLLNYALEHGMINLSYVQEQIDMNKRKELLEKHPYKISQGKDGKWRTYLPDKEKGRRLVKKSSREAVENTVVCYWKAEEENPTVKEVFDEWNDRRLTLQKISPGTHLRNAQVFKRHYIEMGKKHIKSVGPEEYEEFLEEQIPKYSLTAKAFSGLKSITKGFLKRAKKRKLIDFNVEELFQELDTSESDFKRVVKEDSREVFDENELPIVLDYLENELDLKNLGILLMFLTGIRVGELVTLKHSDFNGIIFKVQRTETRVPSPNGGYDYNVKEFPKTEAGVRNAIIPEEYAWVASRLKVQNPFGEYIFFENGKRLTTNQIRRRMERMCRTLKIVPKSPHKARKTYGSILLDNHVDNRLIIDVMGHTNIAMTEGHYHRSRKSLERKARILSEIPEFSAK